MFRKNSSHLQPALLNTLSELSEKQRQRLENSWAGVFYREFFSRIDEEAFAVLYSEKASRPNVPVNVLVGLEVLKAGFGWSDEEMYEHFCYNLQVRYALGYDRLGEGEFEIRTLYYFRERLSRYHAEHGVNLLEKAFASITDAQLTAWNVHTGIQRMDSKQIASNIASSSRLQLLVGGLQRLARSLEESERVQLAEILAPYLGECAEHYTYRIKGEAIPQHLQQIGEHIHTVLEVLRPGYAEKTAFKVLERLFSEHYHLSECGVLAKANTELSAASLQSLDDLEATYRVKGGKGYKGYVVNLSETCDPENELQLITQVQVAPNNVDDSQLLAEAVGELKERTKVETIVADGGYGGKVADKALQSAQVTLVQTAIRGRSPAGANLSLADFQVQFDGEAKPVAVSCPQGQTVASEQSKQQKAFVAHFDPAVCCSCPLLARCPAKAGKRDRRHHLRFTQAEALAAERRRRSREQLSEARNLRAAVESSIRSLTHSFPTGKLPVRGRFRVTCMLIGAAAMTNVRRIQRHLAGKIKTQQENVRERMAEEAVGISFFAALRRFLTAWLCPPQWHVPLASC